MKFVFNASPLIHLAKAGLISMIETLDGEKYTTPMVFHEVVEMGKILGHADALATEQLINKKIIKIRIPSVHMLQIISKAHKDIHKGEAEVITLAKESKAMAILDDTIARAVAKIHGVRTEGTYGVILRALVKGSINKENAVDALQKLVSSGWRCDIQLYNELMKLILETK